MEQRREIRKKDSAGEGFDADSYMDCSPPLLELSISNGEKSEEIRIGSKVQQSIGEE